MIVFEAKIIKVGRSAFASIPNKIMQEFGLKKNQTVQAAVLKKN